MIKPTVQVNSLNPKKDKKKFVFQKNAFVAVGAQKK